MHYWTSHQLWLGRKAPPPPSSKTGKIFLDWIYPFQAISNNFGSDGRKAPCLFMRDPAHITHVEYPWSPYYKSTHRFLLSEYLLYVTNFINFLKYSPIQKYRTQILVQVEGPIGSFTKIHTNIPAIPVTVLAIAL